MVAGDVRLRRYALSSSPIAAIPNSTAGWSLSSAAGSAGSFARSGFASGGPSVLRGGDPSFDTDLPQELAPAIKDGSEWGTNPLSILFPKFNTGHEEVSGLKHRNLRRTKSEFQLHLGAVLPVPIKCRNIIAVLSFRSDIDFTHGTYRKTERIQLCNFRRRFKCEFGLQYALAIKFSYGAHRTPRLLPRTQGAEVNVTFAIALQGTKQSSDFLRGLLSPDRLQRYASLCEGPCYRQH